MEKRIIEKIIGSNKIRLLSECLYGLENIEYNHLTNIKTLALDYEQEYYCDDEDFKSKWGEDKRLCNMFTIEEWINLSEGSIIAYLGVRISEECDHISQKMFNDLN